VCVYEKGYPFGFVVNRMKTLQRLYLTSWYNCALKCFVYYVYKFADIRSNDDQQEEGRIGNALTHNERYKV
jgi:hypothetical protein